MNYYLLTFCIFDGGHEHYTYITTQAENEEAATKKALTQEHEDEMPEGEDPELTMFDYGDGETICKFKYAKEITKAQMEALDDTGVANFYLL